MNRSCVVLHGANLDLLGERPAVHYGTITLAGLEQMITPRRIVWVGSASACRQTMKAASSSICTTTGERTP